jgi:pilus assembly protein CpaC
MVIAQVRGGLPRKVLRPFLDRKWFQSASNPLITGCPLGEFGEVHNPPGISATPNASPTPSLFGTISNRAAFLGVLDALREENLAKVLAEPRLITLSGRPASFFSGSEQAMPVSNDSGQVGVQFEEIGTRINAIPIVLDNGKIHLELEAGVGQLNPGSSTKVGSCVLPGRSTTRINTSLDLEAGQTFVLGGLIQKTVHATALKVPVLGDLPVVGDLFTTKTFCEEEVETIVLVTPSLVNPTPGEQTAESCSQEPRPPSAAKPNQQEQEESPRKDVGERLRRLERRLQKLQKEIVDLQCEVHSLRANDRDSSREQ